MVEAGDVYEERELAQYTEEGKRIVRQPIVKEAPLTIMLNGKKLATLLCSPHSFELLAVGFLVNQGVLFQRDELKSMAYAPEQGAVWVETTGSAAPSGGVSKGNSDRLGGGAGLSLYSLSVAEHIRPELHEPRFTPKELLGLVTRLEAEAHTFRLTGGVHEAALADRAGFVVSYEDIGRHNALDRVLGYAFLNDIGVSDKAVILSGRIASEMLAKAARLGVPVVVSRSAPTCLSIDMADQLGITLVGFARGNSLNVYTHPGRIAV